MKATLDVHVYTEDGGRRCAHCGLGRDQGRGAGAHTLPDLPDAREIDARIVGEGQPSAPVETPDVPSGSPVRVGLDWRKDGARVGALKPCVDCGRGAVLRDPASGEPRHKVCAERELARLVAANSGGAR